MKCPNCGEPVGADDRFCEACRAELPGAPPTGPDGGDPESARPCARCGAPVPREASGDDAEFCPTCGLRRSIEPEFDRVETDLTALGGVSDRGWVHERNEDALALGERPGGAAAVVCDGVSSVRDPQLAARAAARAALAVLLGGSGEPGVGQPDRAERRVRAAISAAAAAVKELSEPGDSTGPSCTLVCAEVEFGGGTDPLVTVGWVGDSRAYWLADPRGAEPSRRLTTDHSWASLAVRAGLLDEAAALASPVAHVITRCLGPDSEDSPDVLTWRAPGPGVLLLCTDGLWNYLPEADELAAALPPPRPGLRPVELARHLTQIALDAGGEDNITAVAIPLRGQPTSAEGEETG